jgi:hypothetical protein
VVTETAIEDRLEELEHGPAFTVWGWFGMRRPHAKSRYLRAVYGMRATGLLVVRKRWGRKLSAIRLTAAGMAKANELETPRGTQ